MEEHENPRGRDKEVFEFGTLVAFWLGTGMRSQYRVTMRASHVSLAGQIWSIFPGVAGVGRKSLIHRKSLIQ